MSRKTIPLLTISITALLVVLVVIVALQLASPDRRWARESRNTAVKVLLGNNLGLIAASLSKPLTTGGSLDNLNHFLTKDPGRAEFPRPSDRRRVKDYLKGETGDRAAVYGSELKVPPLPAWAPMYTGTVKSLFDEVRTEILILAGIPGELTSLAIPSTETRPHREEVERAVGEFARNWIPPGETKASYTLDRTEVRGYLLKSRKFSARMEELDTGWRNLAAALYNLSVNPRWFTAVQYRPELKTELDELIILVLTADIYFRDRDVMAMVPDNMRQPGDPVSPGIIWSPESSYYKNIPEITGQTSDEIPTIFFAKVDLGYTFRDTRTQTWLNRRKDWLTDFFSTFFSSTKSEDFSPVDNRNPTLFAWKSARLKAEAIHRINRNIVSELPFGVNGVYGVRVLAFVRVNLLANP